jgi:hypothetical protein
MKTSDWKSLEAVSKLLKDRNASAIKAMRSIGASQIGVA